MPPPDLLNYKSTGLIHVGYQRNATETTSEGDPGNLPDLDFAAAYSFSPYNKLTVITYRYIQNVTVFVLHNSRWEEQLELESPPER